MGTPVILSHGRERIRPRCASATAAAESGGCGGDGGGGLSLAG